MEVTYQNIRNPAFMQTVQRLSLHSFRSQKTAYDVMQIVKKIEDESKTAQTLFTKLLKQFAKLDEQGEFAPHAGVPGTYEIPEEKNEEYGRALDEFQRLSFTVKRHKIKLDLLEDFALSAQDMQAVECLLDLPAELS